MKGFRNISLTVVVCLLIATVSITAQTAYKISAPYTHKNLTIFLIHGADASSNKDLITLEEALKMKIFKVYETDDVNELMVENISSKYDVFIQSGDIVKGGKQDRVLAISIIIPRNSGKVSIEAFCVESGRWSGRGNESRSEFASSEERVVTKELKMATNGIVTRSGTGNGSGTGTGSGSGDGVGGGSGTGTGAGRGSQTEVWKEVENAQKNISANIDATVTVNASSSSLQLSLENKKLKKDQQEFAKNLEDITKGRSDVIGYAFAINGKLNSADIYVSNHLFVKLWPKMLNAAVVEAISLAHQPKAETEPAPGDVQTFLADAEKGSEKERGTVARSKVVTRATENEAVYEMRDRSNNVVHRNYVKLN
ncbi:MAG TPA: DUF6569 family protein [Pyrinomonadaceae bacterium]